MAMEKDKGVQDHLSLSTSRKRSRQEDDVSMREVIAAISPGRLTILSVLFARLFVRQNKQVMNKVELLDGVNADIAEGERPFDDVEFDSGLLTLEQQNKILVTGEGDVYLL